MNIPQLKEITRTAHNTLDYTVLNNIENMPNRIPTNLWTTSHNFNNIWNFALENTCINWLINLLNIVNNTQTQITGTYRNYNDVKISENIQKLVNYTPSNTVIIAYTPKGTTHITEIEKDTQRNTTIERFLIEDIKHFIRVYYINDNSVFIVTNKINSDIIWKTILSLPIILKINNTDEKIAAITDIFAKLYEIYNSVEEKEISKIKDEILEKIKNLQNILHLTDIGLEHFKTNFNEKINFSKLNSLKNDVQETKRKIEIYENDLKELYNNYYEKNKELNLYKTVQTEDFKNFFEMLKNNKYIRIISANSNEIKLNIKTPLKYFTPADFEIYENNTNNALHRALNENEIKALHKILVTQEYKILIQSAIEIGLVSHSPYYYFGNDANYEKNGTIFNPHIRYYDCWSEYKNEINKAIANHNFELIIPLLINATASINIGEAVTFFNHFIKDLKNDNEDIEIITPDNTIIKWQDYLEIIKGENNAEN